MSSFAKFWKGCWPVYSSGEILQVLFDLFRHDVRLWKAYSTTLQVYVIYIIDRSYTHSSMHTKWSIHAPVCYLCTSHTQHLLNIKICWKTLKRNFHQFPTWKKNESEYRFHIWNVLVSCWINLLSGFHLAPHDWLIDQVSCQDYASFPLDLIVGTGKLRLYAGLPWSSLQIIMVIIHWIQSSTCR